MHRSRAFKFLVAALALGSALALSLATAAPDPSDAAPAALTRRVETAAVTASHAGEELRFAGTVRPVQRARLSFTMGGRLVARPVEVGERVLPGTVVARLETDGPSHAVAAAEAAHAEAAARAEQAARERERVEGLVAARAATPEELERTRAAAESAAAAAGRAAAELREARRRLDETELVAPWAATVTRVDAEPGEYLAAGTPVLSLSGSGPREVEVRVPESLLADLATGREATVALPFEGSVLSGRVSSVGRAAEGAGRLFPVLVSLPPGSEVAAGATAEVVLRRTARGALSVPLAAVLNPGGDRPAVFAVRDGRAVRVPVAVAALEGARVAVRGDLAAGDPVVVAGHSGLIDGDAVEVER